MSAVHNGAGHYIADVATGAFNERLNITGHATNIFVPSDPATLDGDGINGGVIYITCQGPYMVVSGGDEGVLDRYISNRRSMGSAEETHVVEGWFVINIDQIVRPDDGDVFNRVALAVKTARKGLVGLPTASIKITIAHR